MTGVPVHPGEVFVLRDQPWADVVVDLRGDPRPALPSRPFTGRRKAAADGVQIAATTRGGATKMSIVKWTDRAGFTGAVVVDDTSRKASVRVLPHLSHLGLPRRTPHKFVTDSQDRCEALFAASSDVLRDALLGDLTAPLGVRGHSVEDTVVYRFAWASVGVGDPTTLPVHMRHRWSGPRTVPPTGPGADQMWPPVLRLNGPMQTFLWQRAGFDDLSVIFEWARVLYPACGQDIGWPANPEGLAALSQWHRAGFSIEDTLEWRDAAELRTGAEFLSRTLDPVVVADLRAYGVEQEDLAALLVGVPSATTPLVAGREVTKWVRAFGSYRAVLYKAAGMTLAEARVMERSVTRPSDEDLSVLGALRH